MAISLPLDTEIERSGAKSTLMIDMSLDIDMEELIREGAEPFAARARAILEEKLKVLLTIPWANLKKALRPEPEIRSATSSQVEAELASPSPERSAESATTPPASA